MRRRPRYRPGQELRFILRRTLSPRPVGRALTGRLAVPPSWARAILRSGTLRVDGRARDPEEVLPLEAGTVLEVTVPDPWPPHLQPTPMDLTLLYEDAHFAAIDKPPGRVVHPARGHMENESLQNGMLYRYRADLADPETTVAPPHRLDRDTSGVLLFSRTRPAYRALVAAFSAGRVRKEYLCLVEGNPDFETTEVRAPLGEDPDHPSRGAVRPLHEGGREAWTDFHLLEDGDGWALLRAVPRTGRPHQIRLHARHLGHPVLGDRDYHPEPERRALPRQALHAATLSLDHPVTGQPLRITAPWPRDLAAALDRLRGG